MQDTARHDLRSPRHIPDPPCKVSRGVSTGTACYVIGPRTVNSLHDGALPVVVLFGCHGPHMQPVAYQCANLERLSLPIERRARGLSRSLFLLSRRSRFLPLLLLFVSISSFARSRSRVSSTLSLFLLARGESRQRRKKAGPSSMRHAIEGGEVFRTRWTHRLAKRLVLRNCCSRADLRSKMTEKMSERKTRERSVSESFEVRLRGWFAISDPIDFGAQLPIGHASEPRTCSHGRSRSGTRGPQYLTHGSQSDYQIKVGRADARADRVDTGAEIRPARALSRFLPFFRVSVSHCCPCLLQKRGGARVFSFFRRTPGARICIIIAR